MEPVIQPAAEAAPLTVPAPAANPDEAAVREARATLRHVQQHLIQVQLNLGTELETSGLVEVLHHPVSTLPALNYVTPRRSTAWITRQDVVRGLDTLRHRHRTPRFCYLDTLFPAAFATVLTSLKLEVETLVPVLAAAAPDPASFTSRYPLPALPDGVTLRQVDSHEGSALWWYVWRNAYYDVLAHTVEPAIIGLSLMQLAHRQQLDLVLYRYGFPVGVARLTLNTTDTGKSAHLTALALLREVRTPALLQTFQRCAVHTAFNEGCGLVFVTAATEAERRTCLDNGFVDYGNLVCYAEAQPDSVTSFNGADTRHEPVAQPLPVLL